MKTYVKEPRVQGRDSIMIQAPASLLWPLIQDSSQLLKWGPPVEKVEVRLAQGQSAEAVGSERKVFARFTEKRKGWYEEVRTRQEEGRSITFLIYNDNFGMGKLLEDVGASMELIQVSESQTEFVFTFYHRPKNLMGWLMNPMIKADQRKNRLKALKSIKNYVEKGKAIKN